MDNLPEFTAEWCQVPKTCPTCRHIGRTMDANTYLCVECWRVVVLAPAAMERSKDISRSIDNLLGGK